MRSKVVVCIGVVVCASATTKLFAQYEPPATYYDSATGVGAVLAQNLNNIIDNHVVRSYDSARQSLQILDEDPSDPERIILIYTGASVIDDWDAGVTWNREHLWPRSLGVGESGPDNSDLFNLRPSDPSVNESRGNKPFGTGPGYWDPQGVALPGVNHRGDCSRAIFYMAIRYDGSDINTLDLTLVNGFPVSPQMGDLAKMLEWHYSDPVNAIERRRNHLIWSSTDNPLYFQGNRNPFVDHAEFVWAIWGTSPNDSTLYVGATEPGDGASAAELEVEVIVGGVAAVQTVSLHKTGTTPTTFDVMTTGDIVVEPAGRGQAFVGGTQLAFISITPTSTSVPGLVAGEVLIDNTDLTSAGPGEGVADGDDEIAFAARVLDHSEASFQGASDMDFRVIDLGTVPFQSGLRTVHFEIFNLNTTPGFTAALDLIAVNGSGDDDSGILYADVQPFAGLPAGSSQTFTATLDSSILSGSFETSYVLQVADADLPGGQSGSPLLLMLTASVLQPVPCSQVSDCGPPDPCLSPACVGRICAFAPHPYGDVNGDQVVDLLDILCALDGFAGQFQTCQLENLDVAPCGGDGFINLADIFGVLDAYRGLDGCCGN